ncbi:MAG: PTS glucose transporter subunit IIA, partial [Oscillospiraceae bacterium]|nr:PTS glucose transporter subunit IIA [Oscillospiraceae bacterium]
DTVKLNGEGFQALVKAGDKVTAGTPLIKFDKEVIKAAGYGTTVIMAVTNSADYPQMQKHEDAEVVVTGGLAPVILPYCTGKYDYDEFLLPEGLKLICNRTYNRTK